MYSGSLINCMYDSSTYYILNQKTKMIELKQMNNQRNRLDDNSIYFLIVADEAKTKDL